MDAEKLILLTDTPGILRDRDDPRSLIDQLSLSEARELINAGVVAGSMVPKPSAAFVLWPKGACGSHP